MELVFIATILVIGLMDVGQAVGALNQSHQTSGARVFKLDGSVAAQTFGSVHRDFIDEVDNQTCAPVLVCEPTPEPVKP